MTNEEKVDANPAETNKDQRLPPSPNQADVSADICSIRNEINEVQKCVKDYGKDSRLVLSDLASISSRLSRMEDAIKTSHRGVEHQLHLMRGSINEIVHQNQNTAAPPLVNLFHPRSVTALERLALAIIAATPSVINAHNQIHVHYKIMLMTFPACPYPTYVFMCLLPPHEYSNK